MASGDAEQGQSRPLGAATILLPIAQCVNRNAQCVGEGRLGQPGKAAQSGNILATFDLPGHEALTYASRDGPGKVRGTKFAIDHA